MLNSEVGKIILRMFSRRMFIPALQYRPFCITIKPLSECNKHHIGVQKRLYQRLKWAVSQSRGVYVKSGRDVK